MKEKILFVCQRYGMEINGGAEMECRAYAEHLTDIYDVSVLTTCALDYMSWDLFYPEGESEINGVKVFRVRNEEGRRKNWLEVYEKVCFYEHSEQEESEWIDAQGPYCPQLVDFIRNHYSEYKVVIFMTYLYYTTVKGMIPELDNAILIPTAHDEPMIHLNIFRDVFRKPKAYIYNTEEEKKFVEKTFPYTKEKASCIVGYGIDIPKPKYLNVKEKFGLTNYILYAGRIARAKGCPELISYFIEYKKKNHNDVKLVLIGKNEIDIPKTDDIVELGFVEEDVKYNLMRDAKVFALASPRESLSIVVLEAMAMGTPVLVNSVCDVLKAHCENSNAGLYFCNFTEFELTLNYLLEHSDIYEIMQENGKKYVKEKYQWKNIVPEIQKIIDGI